MVDIFFTHYQHSHLDRREGIATIPWVWGLVLHTLSTFTLRPEGKVSFSHGSEAWVLQRPCPCQQHTLILDFTHPGFLGSLKNDGGRHLTLTSLFYSHLHLPVHAYTYLHTCMHSLTHSHTHAHTHPHTRSRTATNRHAPAYAYAPCVPHTAM